MATAKELQEVVEGLNKSLDEAQGAIRRLAQDNNAVLEMVRKLTEKVTGLEAELNKVKVAQQSRIPTTQAHANSITRYE